MGTNSESRKALEALERAPFLVCEHQQRREAAQRALACVYSGAGFDEADALLLALEDAGAWIEVRP